MEQISKKELLPILTTNVILTADLNGCVRVSVDYGSSIIGTVNTLIDKSQIINL